MPLFLGGFTGFEVELDPRDYICKRCCSVAVCCCVVERFRTFQMGFEPQLFLDEPCGILCRKVLQAGTVAVAEGLPFVLVFLLRIFHEEVDDTRRETRPTVHKSDMKAVRRTGNHLVRDRFGLIGFEVSLGTIESHKMVGNSGAQKTFECAEFSGVEFEVIARAQESFARKGIAQRSIYGNRTGEIGLELFRGKSGARTRLPSSQ